MSQYIYLVPLFPLLGFLIAGLGRNSLPKIVLGWIPTLAVVASFIVSLIIFKEVSAGNIKVVNIYDFINLEGFNIKFGFKVDQLSSLFLLIITGIGSLIHIYSTGYMHDDEGYGKFFAYLNLFIFSMLLLVLGSNFLIMFIGWEGVGLCSYLLIGFWYKNIDYTKAARKAFVMNRIGDVGFIIAMLLLFNRFGTLDIDTILNGTATLRTDSIFVVAVTLCLFIGATGKSAQIPLFTWLPDAMAGPTPVSALIHAATMVTAGIYMITRSHLLFTIAPITQHVILMIGGATAIVAATIATRQNDIKKVLAYSTVSQLGFMFMALGVGAYVAAVFHVITHAFFKALLFLGSGSVIHGMSGEQDIRYMGGLSKKMKTTYLTFLIGCIAIAGIPPLSGFFSKDEIMLHVFTYPNLGKFFWIVGMLAAMMTAYYMFRLLFLTFYGKFRGTHEQEHHLHESPTSMTIPLIILAIFSVIGGFIGFPEVFGVGEHWLKEFLEPVLEKSILYHKVEHVVSHSQELMLMGVAVVIALAGISFAYSEYKKYNPNKINNSVEDVFANKWFFDEAYDKVISKPVFILSNFFDKVIEKLGIDAFVNKIGVLVNSSSNKLRLLQTGLVGSYLFIMVFGAIILFLLLLIFK